MNKKTLLALIYVLWTTALHGQIDQFNISFPHLSTVDQFDFDEKGYLWMARGEFEGYTIIKYSGRDKLIREIADVESRQFVGDIIFHEDGILLGQDNQLQIFNQYTNDKELIWSFDDTETYLGAYKDEKNRAWIFTKNNVNDERLLYLKEDGAQIRKIGDLSGNNLFNYEGEKSHVYDIDGIVYLVDNSGIIKITDDGETELITSINDRCGYFRADNHNNFWWFNDTDIKQFDIESGRYQANGLTGQLRFKNYCNTNLNGFVIETIFIDSQHRMWLGAEDSNLFMYDPKSGEIISFNEVLLKQMGGYGGSVVKLIEDHAGNIWGQKRGGLFKISDKKMYFESYLVDTRREDHPLYQVDGRIVEGLKQHGSNGLIDAEVSSIEEDGLGNIYCLDRRFVYKINRSNQTEELVPLITARGKIGLEIYDNKMWVSIWDALYTSDDFHTFEKYPFDIKRITDFYQTSDGQIWIYGYLDTPNNPFLANVQNDAQSQPIEYSDPRNGKRINETVYALMEMDDGDLWVCTSSDFYTISDSTGYLAKMTKPLLYNSDTLEFNNRFTVFHNLGENLLGIVDNRGIAKLNTKTLNIESYISAKELGLSMSYGYTHFTSDAVWFAAGRDLCYYSFTTSEFINISESEGLLVKEYIREITPLSDGSMGIGTSNGLYIFHPDTLLYRYREDLKLTGNVSLELTEVSVFRSVVDSVVVEYMSPDFKETIEVEYEDKFLQFDFALAHYTNPEEHMFSYMLEGYEDKWSIPNRSNEIKFTSLPFGEYTLKVRANTGNGYWTSEVASIPIVVNTPWYLAWWFLAFCVIILSLLVFGGFRYFYVEERRQLQLEKERSEAQKLKELDQLKSRFYTNITHEFRTPLTVIMGMMNSVKCHEKEKNLVLANSDKLLKLVNNLLDLSKTSSGQMTVEYVQGDIIPYLKNLTASFELMAQENKIELSFNADPDAIVMRYDEHKIQQIAYNLLSNAIRFTNEDGHVSVAISVLQKESSGYLQMEISDTGIGITEQEMPRLFDRFYQVDNAISRMGEGTGIGLALTKELLELLNGNIDVESEVGVGSKFIVHLPLVYKEDMENVDIVLLPPDSSDTQHVNTEDDIELAINNTETNNDPVLLVVEDNKDLAFYIASLFKDRYNIHTASNGQAGIDLAIELIPDIIISDVMMPIKDGYELCDALKNNEKTSHIPIILLTAKALQSDRVRGLKYGADAYIVKPFYKEELQTRVVQLQESRKRMLRQLRLNNDVHQVDSPILFPSQKEFLRKIEMLVETNISDEYFGVKELEHLLSMSSTQVYRKIKAITDSSPSVYIRSVRLEKGKKLLKETDDNIAQIAYAVGFSDPNYFSRTFQQTYGQSPRSYRQKTFHPTNN